MRIDYLVHYLDQFALKQLNLTESIHSSKVLYFYRVLLANFFSTLNIVKRERVQRSQFLKEKPCKK